MDELEEHWFWWGWDMFVKLLGPLESRKDLDLLVTADKRAQCG